MDTVKIITSICIGFKLFIIG